MNLSLRRLACCLSFLFLAASPLTAQEAPTKIPASVFLPFDNERSSEPGLQRVYKKAGGKILPPEQQPKGYPHELKPSYILKNDEAISEHHGTDYTSRDQSGKPVPLDFKAGVYGTVIEPRVGMIKVEVDELKNRIEYLHNSKTYVAKGDKVKPDDLLGVSGNINPDTGKPAAGMGIHLHVQAKTKNGTPLQPDEVVAYARKPLNERREAQFFAPLGVQYKSDPVATDYTVSWRRANGVTGQSSHGTLREAQKEAEKLFQGNNDLTEVGQGLRIVSVSIKGRVSTGKFGPGTYASTSQAGEGTLRLMRDGKAEYTIKKRDGESLTVTGIWKEEENKVWIQWQGGDFKGTPKWHDGTDDLGKAKRIKD